MDGALKIISLTIFLVVLVVSTIATVVYFFPDDEKTKGCYFFLHFMTLLFPQHPKQNGSPSGFVSSIHNRLT
ncbi:hypothetical protein GGGNBK_23240 (plasmid) [Sporosarcina sp. ANT_H38]